MEKEELLSISSAANYIGVSVQTLRNYDKKGILKPAYVMPSGIRKYNLCQIEKFMDKMRGEGYETWSNSIF